MGYVRASQVQPSTGRIQIVEPSAENNEQPEQDSGAASAQAQSPEDFIRQYYQWYVDGYTNQTWAMLTGDYQQKLRIFYSNQNKDLATEYQRLADMTTGVDVDLRQTKWDNISAQFEADVFFYDNNGENYHPSMTIS
jgi:hypothetical protein